MRSHQQEPLWRIEPREVFKEPPSQVLLDAALALREMEQEAERRVLNRTPFEQNGLRFEVVETRVGGRKGIFVRFAINEREYTFEMTTDEKELQFDQTISALRVWLRAKLAEIISEALADGPGEAVLRK